MYIINTESVQYGYGEGESETPYDFKGTIRFVSNYSSDSGLIIIEYTKKPDYTSYNGRPFFAVYYRNLKPDTVQLANAINLADFSAPDTDTLEEALEKFTRNSMALYVNWAVVQPQKRID